MRRHSTETIPSRLATVHSGRIAVGFDDTPAGRAALAWAAEEAEIRGAALTICHVRRPSSVGAGTPDLPDVAFTDPLLGRLLRADRERVGGSRVDLRLPAGDVTQALLALAREVDLVVVGGCLSRDPLHHRVAFRLATWAHTPVTIVRPGPIAVDAPFAGHVVVGLDGTAASRAALRYGLAHATRHRLPLAVVNVDSRPTDGFWCDDSIPEAPSEYAPAPLDLLATELERAGHGHGDVAIKQGVYHGDPVKGLLHSATGAALLAIGRHGDRMPAVALRLGSVAAALAAEATCVVTVVPGTVVAGNGFERLGLQT